MQKVGLRYATFTGRIICKTGLRIGGSKEELEIGGMDNPIIRDPLSKLPYIPGSSLKGKLRSLLEYKHNRVGLHWDKGQLIQKGGSPCGCGQDECPVCRIFGAHKNMAHNLGPSRLIVRDALLSDKSKKELEPLREGGLEYAEVKTENIINRDKNTAEHPRPMERVPQGTEFDLNLSLRILNGDNEPKMKEYINEAINLIQKDYLGGSGTRGYGWVQIEGDWD
ncbi:MAG: type III-A CRISPR-associated RAMP protein Csm3 [Dehalococcoidia bacterium]|nr:type III-A CRISPR-associated RAMP protein Csm3 [Dehalococcoidia bacterium]